jgi:hypothetical protein
MSNRWQFSDLNYIQKVLQLVIFVKVSVDIDVTSANALVNMKEQPFP